MNRAGLLVLLITIAGCQEGLKPTSGSTVAAFSGEFTLVFADDWTDKQACNYVIPVDQTVCSWGRLAITADRLAISVRGFEVHLGSGRSGPLLSRDSTTSTATLLVVDACTVTIDSVGFTPNGRGTLKADTLRFNGTNAGGDSLSWVYQSVQVQLTKPCQ